MPSRTELWLTMVTFTLLFGVVLAQLPVFPPEKGTYLVYVSRVIDGDTVEFYWCTKADGRLSGINAPELEGSAKEAGLASKKGLEGLCPPGFYTVTCEGREKYGRTLITISDKLGNSVNQRMLDLKLAKPWDGKGQRP